MISRVIFHLRDTGSQVCVLDEDEKQGVLSTQGMCQSTRNYRILTLSMESGLDVSTDVERLLYAIPPKALITTINLLEGFWITFRTCLQYS